jgi:hypothetical protein
VAEVKKAAEKELAGFYPDPDGARPIAYCGQGRCAGVTELRGQIPLVVVLGLQEGEPDVPYEKVVRPGKHRVEFESSPRRRRAVPGGSNRARRLLC